MYRITRPILYTAIAVITLIQIAIISHVGIGSSRPDIAVIAVIFFGLFFGSAAGAETGIGFGLLRDILGAPGAFGLNIAILGIIGFFAGILADKVYREHPFTQALGAFFVVWCLTHANAGSALYSAFVAPLEFLILMFLFETREVSWIEFEEDNG
ncbi:MAG: hypothetical protein PHS37_07640 [Candidatus Omnitrophica bacterium]|nr:hypothetical protein [Candidatus Omnitrophota bacterium]